MAMLCKYTVRNVKLLITARSKNNNNDDDDDDFEVAHPQSGSSSTWFLVELEFGNVDFWGDGKTGVPGEKPLGEKERTNNKLNPHMESNELSLKLRNIQSLETFKNSIKTFF